jgi:hypothetical protein
MRGKIEFTDEQLAGMKVSYLVGASLEALSFEYGVSKMVIWRRLKGMGVKLRPVGCPTGNRKPEIRRQAKDMLAAGHRKQDIAKALHVGLRTVYRYLEA